MSRGRLIMMAKHGLGPGHDPRGHHDQPAKAREKESHARQGKDARIIFVYVSPHPKRSPCPVPTASTIPGSEEEVICTGEREKRSEVRYFRAGRRQAVLS